MLRPRIYDVYGGNRAPVHLSVRYLTCLRVSAARTLTSYLARFLSIATPWPELMRRFTFRPSSNSSNSSSQAHRVTEEMNDEMNDEMASESGQNSAGFADCAAAVWHNGSGDDDGTGVPGARGRSCKTIATGGLEALRGHAHSVRWILPP